MKKVLAYVPTWGCYWSGHFTSRIMERLDDKFGDDEKELSIITIILYPVYSKLMGWSLFFNDWGGLDCWVTHVPEEEDES